MRTVLTKSIAIASFACLEFASTPASFAHNPTARVASDRQLAAAISADRPVSTQPSQTQPTQLAVIPWGGVTPKNVFQAKIKRRLNGIPVIDVTFNNSRKFEMIVDTGASGTLITRAMAGALRVKIIGSVRSGIADGSVVEFPIGRVQSIAVDGAEVKNVPVAIADQMDIGLLGHDFFGRYDMQIKQDVVEFHRRAGK